ncbi:hypothetical protein DJ010_11655 [Nocardioides silvaticus]|uniref:DUF559 domain-containing protein n=1 Tax=Nocardioides silvaticus TaxID=2201891 RepID=A0A316TIG6_9ACTN|nr:hypothetical protein [Nocardioides silvaticus]PWN03019.1 hypothetical protein DJ010_11655 [Nocardioides silvaticus]
MARDRWRQLAEVQAGLLTRAQLASLGIDRWAIRHRVRTERWVELTPTVVGTATGILSREQLMWLGVLHGGRDAMVGELTAGEVHGLRNWHRDDVTIVVPHGTDIGSGYSGIRYVRTRRTLAAQRASRPGVPVCRIEPAVLCFASQQRSPRTAEGVLAAVVQQQLTTPEALSDWIGRLAPLRGAARFRRSLEEIAGGAHSVAEIDVRRMCRAYGLAPPTRQVRRRDASGRLRFTDCEWRLADGRVLVLEVDGAFHMDVASWEDDIARQRALTSPDRHQVRCTARELRDEPWRVARDLKLLGVPPA